MSLNRELPEIRAFHKVDALGFDLPAEAVQTFDPSLVAAEDNEDGVITIYGYIGLDPMTAVDNTERRISAAIRAIGQRDLTVNLNSPGGNFFNGLAIYNLLRLHRAKVTVNIVGMAGSAASVIAMAGDEIMMGDGTSIMVHNASAIVIGNKFDTQEVSEILADIDDAMAEIYAARAKVEKTVAAAWMDRHRGGGTSFYPTTAIAKGLADGRLDSSKVKSAFRAEQQKPVAAERVIERALMAAAGKSANEAKALIAEMKTGTRDAAGDIKRDADADWTAFARSLTETLKR